MDTNQHTYTTEEFLGVLADARRIQTSYNQGKHTMDLLQAIQAREELAIVTSQLSDMDADLYFEKLRTDTLYRISLLEKTEEYEKEFWAGTNPDTKKKWTNIENRARYRAELDCKEMREAADLAKKDHARAFFLHTKALPDVLNSMSSRIGLLIRQMPLGQPLSGELDESKPNSLPSARKWGLEDDGFSKWDVQRNVGQSLEELDLEWEHDKSEE